MSVKAPRHSAGRESSRSASDGSRPTLLTLGAAERLAGAAILSLIVWLAIAWALAA